jgi:hypothetical protein
MFDFIRREPVIILLIVFKKLQNQSDQSSSCHAKKKEESNKNARGGLSITYSGTNEVGVIENLVSENVSTIKAKVSLEELAKNRGDAMLRYKEKKKTRRYINFFHA